MIRATSISRTPGALVLASGAPTPLRSHRRGKIGKPASSEPATAVLRSPVDVLADQIADPILRAAVREPVAFWGGIFAGVLRLSLDQDPLRTWVERTASQAKPSPLGTTLGAALLLYRISRLRLPRGKAGGRTSGAELCSKTNAADHQTEAFMPPYAHRCS